MPRYTIHIRAIRIPRIIIYTHTLHTCNTYTTHYMPRHTTHITLFTRAIRTPRIICHVTLHILSSHVQYAHRALYATLHHTYPLTRAIRIPRIICHVTLHLGISVNQNVRLQMHTDNPYTLSSHVQYAHITIFTRAIRRIICHVTLHTRNSIAYVLYTLYVYHYSTR